MPCCRVVAREGCNGRAARRAIMGRYDLEAREMTESSSPAVLGYEPRAAFAQHADPAMADCQGKRIGILVVTYNALSTLIPVLKRIPPSVWRDRKSTRLNSSHRCISYA